MAQAPRILVYDGDCAMCTRFSKLAERRWLCGPAERRPADAFEGETAARLRAAGVHNELAVLDPDSGEIRTGYDGIVWLLAQGRLRGFARLLSWRPLAALLRHDYRLVAFNRRIFSPPARSVACACDPDFHLGYRWTFIGLALFWSVLLGAVFAWLYADRHLAGGLAAPTGWALTALPALRMTRERALTWLGHLAWILAACMLPLLMGLCVLAAQSLAWRLGWLAAPWAASADALHTLGLGSWSAGLAVALYASLRRLPRLGIAKWRALVVALVLWSVPLGVLLLLRSAP